MFILKMLGDLSIAILVRKRRVNGMGVLKYKVSGGGGNCKKGVYLIPGDSLEGTGAYIEGSWGEGDDLPRADLEEEEDSHHN